MPLAFQLDDPAWVAAPSGLKTWDTTVGTGKEAPKGCSVECHYTGWLEDGKVFDSSKTRGQTLTFSLNGVIQGWKEGIPGMKVGGTRRLHIPGAMAYGKSGIPGLIPPNAPLVFEVELIAVK